MPNSPKLIVARLAVRVRANQPLGHLVEREVLEVVHPFLLRTRAR